MKCRDCEKWGWGDDEGTPVWGWCWKYTSCPDPDIDRSCPDFSPKKPDISTTLSTLQAENKKLRAELENYRKGHREEAISALSPPNEWVNRARELDELYTKLQIITGFTVEQLLEMFAAGYTLEKPDYSKSFEEMASLAETTPPNEALTQADLDSMDYDKVWIDYGDNGEWALVVSGRIYSLAVLEGAGFEDILRDEVDGETMDRPSGDYAVYRRPLEGEV
jgi:hypothetical protein